MLLLNSFDSFVHFKIRCEKKYACEKIVCLKEVLNRFFPVLVLLTLWEKYKDIIEVYFPWSSQGANYQLLGVNVCGVLSYTCNSVQTGKKMSSCCLIAFRFWDCSHVGLQEMSKSQAQKLLKTSKISRVYTFASQSSTESLCPGNLVFV